jgi:hypothetical protein
LGADEKGGEGNFADADAAILEKLAAGDLTQAGLKLIGA